MKRNREERFKSSGTHHLLISPHTSEERQERRLLISLFHFCPCIEILYSLILEFLQVVILKIENSNMLEITEK
jgi:hypothetical protein